MAHYIRTPINFVDEVNVNSYKRMNSLSIFNQAVFSISMQYRKHMLQTIRTYSYMVYCIVQFVFEGAVLIPFTISYTVVCGVSQKG